MSIDTAGSTAHDDRPAAFVDPASERSLESLALTVGAGAFVVVGIIALIVFRLESAPIAGPGSLGQFGALSSAAVAIVVFVAGRFLLRERGRPVGVLGWIDIAALAFAHAVIALLSWTLLSVVLEKGFIDAVVFPLAVVVLAGVIAAVTGYLVFFSATHMDLQLLAVLLAVFLAEGIIVSTLTASDPHWWVNNLSALGMTNDLSSFVFNFTLIVGGIIVTTLARYATRDVPSSNPKGPRGVRTSLIVLGIFLALVGVFPVDDFFLVHTLSASGMAVAFIVLAIRLKGWIPGIPPAFVALGYLFVVVILVTAVFYFTGYYTLTAVELVAAVLAFAWIILFIRNAAALTMDEAEPQSIRS